MSDCQSRVAATPVIPNRQAPCRPSSRPEFPRMTRDCCLSFPGSASDDGQGLRLHGDSLLLSLRPVASAPGAVSPSDGPDANIAPAVCAGGECTAPTANTEGPAPTGAQRDLEPEGALATPGATASASKIALPASHDSPDSLPSISTDHSQQDCAPPAPHVVLSRPVAGIGALRRKPRPTLDLLQPVQRDPFTAACVLPPCDTDRPAHALWENAVRMTPPSATGTPMDPATIMPTPCGRRSDPARLPVQLSAYTMSLTMMVFSFPVGFALMIYNILGGERLRTTALALALTAAGYGLYRSGIAEQVLSLL